jgi:hypothetical protein
MLDRRPVVRLQAYIEAAGCTYVRTQGDHLVYHYPGAKRPVVIPKYKEVPVFIKIASENPFLWTGMKDASAESRKNKSDAETSSA